MIDTIFYTSLIVIILMSLITGVITTIIERKDLKAQRTKVFKTIKEVKRKTRIEKSKQLNKQHQKDNIILFKEKNPPKHVPKRVRTVNNINLLQNKHEVEILDLTREVNTQELNIISEEIDDGPKIIKIIDEDVIM